MSKLVYTQEEMVKMYAEIVAYREQVATYERTITKLAEANAAANLELIQLRDALKVLGKHQSSTFQFNSAEKKFMDAKEAREDDIILDELSENIDIAFKLFKETLAAVNANPIAAAAVKEDQ